MIAALRELTDYGYLFRTFLRRDLSSRYKGSALGILWSLLNPLAQLATYSFVFSYVIKIKIKNVGNYPVFFVSGFVPLIISTGGNSGSQASTLVPQYK